MNVATDFVAPVLDIQNVSFTYPDGTPALRDVSLTVQPGSRVAIIGQNGSGKSTLARQMNGLLRPTTGSVRLDGVDIGSHHVAELARTVGLAFQNPDRQIFAGRVATEVGFGPRNLGLRGADLDATVNRALALVGLTAAGDTNPYDLGFARRKLLSLASVIAMDPAIAVLDEPTTGQDVEGVGRVRSVMDDLSSRGRTIIGISHDMRFVAEAFERVIVMRDGRMVLDGTPADVFAEAAWPVLASTFLEPPLAARIGARLGLGSTPTDETLLAALAR